MDWGHDRDSEDMEGMKRNNRSNRRKRNWMEPEEQRHTY